MKHTWTMEDDLTACQKYLEFVFERTEDVATLLDELEKLLPHISRGSLRMKMQNIKQVALEEGLEDHLEIAPPQNYSVQCHKAFLEATYRMAPQPPKTAAKE